LEWISPSDNVKHAIETGLMPTQAREVKQLNKDGSLVKIFKSITEASKETGIDGGTITKVCKNEGKHKSGGGYLWKYVDEDTLAKVSPDLNEKMAKIPGHDDYGITKSGKVYSIKRQRYLNKSKVDGYDRVHLTEGGKRKGILVNILIAEAFKNPEYIDLEKYQIEKYVPPEKPTEILGKDEKSNLKLTDIPGYSNYGITKDGQVYSYKANKLTSQHLDKSKTSMCVSILGDDGKSRNINMQVLLATTFIKNNNPDTHKSVMHIDGDRFNNKLSNLKWCTQGELTSQRKKIAIEKMKQSDNSDSSEDKKLKVSKKATKKKEADSDSDSSIDIKTKKVVKKKDTDSDTNKVSKKKIANKSESDSDSDSTIDIKKKKVTKSKTK